MAEQMIRDVMTRQVIHLAADTSLDEAARIMRDKDIGDVVVSENGTLAGVVTDRDIVIRAVAEGRSPMDTTLGEITSRDIVMIVDDSPISEAVNLMRERAVRRLLVSDSDAQLVGIVTLGDIAATTEPQSPLGEISKAAPNG